MFIYFPTTKTSTEFVSIRAEKLLLDKLTDTCIKSF